MLKSNSQQQSATVSNTSNINFNNSNIKKFILYRLLINYKFVAAVAAVAG
jgi:hypothetical protein